MLRGNTLNDINIEPFITQNCINLQNIKTLLLDGFGKVNNQFDANTFWKLLTKFKNI